MSQEWLKQLAELSNDKDLRKRALQMQKAQRAAAQGGGGQRSLLGAAFGHFFRWLFLFALAEAAAMFVIAENEGLTNEPWGVIFHYLVWYPLTQPIFPEEIYVGLQSWFGVTQADLSAFYDWINPFIQEQQDALVFYLPAAASLALTLFFLPAINAGRRRSPIRFLVWLANWAVVFLVVSWGGGVIVLWLAAFVFSFVGGGVRRAPQPAQPKPQPQQARPTPQQVRAMPPPRPAGRPQKAARPVPAAAPTPAPAAVERAARPAVVLSKREPTVVRRGGGDSWIRAR